MSARKQTAHLDAFLALVFALAAPFWALGASGGMLLPHLPVSALMAAAPALAALAAARLDAREGPRSLLRDAFDLRRLRRRTVWLLVGIALFPALLALAYAAMRLAAAALPEPTLSVARAFVLFFPFFIAGLAEELGWFGYAFAPLEQRHGPLYAALTIGAVWTVWHIIPYAQTGRPVDWILWHCLVTVATRVIAVWLFLRTGRSVLAAALFHAMCNVAYFSFPNGGSHFDAAYLAPIVCAVAVLAAISLRMQPRLGAQRPDG
jgi:membrane protease YdiL (CAAX protease family)